MEGEGTFPNDIAVVEFETEVSGDRIDKIPLAPANSDHAGNTDCWITGWGYTSNQLHLSLIGTPTPFP